jgi:hypothetical protein
MERPHKQQLRLVALDASKRHFDSNGFLHVDGNRLTCDQVAPYYGMELPESPDIDPERIYYAYRPAEELKKALDTYNGVPLLGEHEFDSPDEPLKELRVGAIGTDAEWHDPYITNSLTIWDKAAIEKVQSGELSDLSCGYSFEPEWKEGKTADGIAFDFIMRNIKCNHVALVAKGRATGCKVADTLPNQLEKSAMEENKSACDDFTEWSRKVIGSAGVELTPEQIDKLVRAFAEAHAEFEKNEAEAAKEDVEGTRDEDSDKAEEPKSEDEEEAKDEDKPAEDEDEKKPESEDEDACEDEDKPEAKAGDADIIAKATDAAVKRVSALFKAADAVRSVTGKIDPMSFKTEGAIYAHALKAMDYRAEVPEVSARAVFTALMSMKKDAPQKTADNAPMSDALSAALDRIH